jgi:tRNA U34 5-carboxymethylaminomethyl modifying enzyme MnmG/GidA
VDSGQWIVDSKRGATIAHAVIPSAVTEGNAVEGSLSREEHSAVDPERAEGSSAVLSIAHYPLTPAFLLPAEIRNELKSVETEIKYSGYLDQQSKAIERLKRSEERLIPEWFDYAKVSGLSREMNEKLGRVRPRTLGQASRIPGVTPAAVSLINVYIEIQARRQAAAQQLG